MDGMVKCMVDPWLTVSDGELTNTLSKHKYIKA